MNITLTPKNKGHMLSKEQIEYLNSKNGKKNFAEISEKYGMINPTKSKFISRQALSKARLALISGKMEKWRARKYMEYLGFE